MISEYIYCIEDTCRILIDKSEVGIVPENVPSRAVDDSVDISTI